MMSFLLLILIGFPTIVNAHAFGQTYTLPVPAWMFSSGGAAVVVLSFFIAGFFLRDATQNRLFQEKSAAIPSKVLSWIFAILRGMSLILFILTIIAGLFGNQEPAANFAPTFIWVIFLLGMTYLIAIIGDIWPMINPFSLVITLWEKIRRKPLEGVTTYPERLGYFPAFLFLFCFIWLELIARFSVVPRNIALFLLIYLIITLIAAYYFSPPIWFRYGEFLHVYFRLIGKVAPIEWTETGFRLRNPFIGLLKNRTKHITLLLIILLLLASTAFDGFRSTTWWATFLTSLENRLSHFGWFIVIQSMALIVSILFFFGFYYLFMWFMKKITSNEKSPLQLMLYFAYSLIPIALAYHVAHYVTLLLIQGQLIIPLLSDPFGRGANFFGTLFYSVNPGLISAKTVWYTQVFVIIIGHVASIFIAHLMALRLFGIPKQALISQLPILVLMVLYTMVGLWILSQPLALGS